MCKSPKLQTKTFVNRVDKLWYIYTTAYYKAMKTNKALFT